MLNKLSLGQKIGGGFGILLLLALALNVHTGLEMDSVASDMETLVSSGMPALEYAQTANNNVNDVLVQMRAFNASWAPQDYENAKALFDVIKNDNLPTLQGIAKTDSRLAEITQALNAILPIMKPWEDKMEEGRESTAVMAHNYIEVNKAYNEATTALWQFITEQEADIRNDVAAYADPVRLTHRLDMLFNSLGVMTQIRDINLEMMDSRRSTPMEARQANLARYAALQQLAEETKSIPAELVNQEMVGNVLAAVDNYRTIAGRYAQAAEASIRLGAERTEIINKVQPIFHSIATQRMQETKNFMTSTGAHLRFSEYSLILGAALLMALGIIVAWYITKGITRRVAVSVAALSRVAQRDFTYVIDQSLLKSGDEIGEMLRDVQKMYDNLSMVIESVMEGAEAVTTASSQISEGNRDLSDRTQQQASAIEQTASALEQITSSVRQNASHAAQANSLAQKTADLAQDGGETLERTVTAMQEVTVSSKKINDIINVVNEIAFQTNLLALNAAVEAARAGEAGRGFAVVAGEVRSLAGRSAQASKEIQELITDSVNKVEQGNTLVAESGRILKEIIDGVGSVAGTIQQITSASQEQASGIEEINRAVSQMDQAVQQNAAMVEQTSAASENMHEVAVNMNGQMSSFILPGKKTRALPDPSYN